MLIQLHGEPGKVFIDPRRLLLCIPIADLARLALSPTTTLVVPPLHGAEKVYRLFVVSCISPAARLYAPHSTYCTNADGTGAFAIRPDVLLLEVRRTGELQAFVEAQGGGVMLLHADDVTVSWYLFYPSPATLLGTDITAYILVLEKQRRTQQWPWLRSVQLCKVSLDDA
jgi:hypothetical protein